VAPGRPAGAAPAVVFALAGRVGWDDGGRSL